MFPARARMTFRLAHTAFFYWRTIGHECYCSPGEIKLEGTLVERVTEVALFKEGCPN